MPNAPEEQQALAATTQPPGRAGILLGPGRKKGSDPTKCEIAVRCILSPNPGSRSRTPVERESSSVELELLTDRRCRIVALDT